MCEFNKQDVLIIAKAILDDPVEYFDSDHRCYYFCNYCEAELDGIYHTIDDFKHDLDCPCLIAQDLLTIIN